MDNTITSLLVQLPIVGLLVWIIFKYNEMIERHDDGWRKVIQGQGEIYRAEMQNVSEMLDRILIGFKDLQIDVTRHSATMTERFNLQDEDETTQS